MSNGHELLMKAVVTLALLLLVAGESVTGATADAVLVATSAYWLREGERQVLRPSWKREDPEGPR